MFIKIILKHVWIRNFPDKFFEEIRDFPFVIKTFVFVYLWMTV